MKAIQLYAYGTPDQLRYEDVPTPEAGPGQVLVRVHAASVNHIDWGKASGGLQHLFPLTFPWIPGGDFAGTVAAVGPGVSAWPLGTEVYGTCVAGGAYADYVVVTPEVLAAKPARLSFVEAASVPIVALTAWQALFRHAQVQAGQTVLIQGGAGAVGAYAVQFAHQHGVRVVATAAGADLDFVRSLGADEVIDYQTTAFETVVSPVDAVLDFVGGAIQQRSYAVLKAGGYLVATNQPPSLAEAARQGVHALLMNMEPSPADLTHIAHLFDAGTITVDVAHTYPLAQAAAAWRDIARHLPARGAATATATPAVAAPKTHGKIVLEVA